MNSAKEQARNVTVRDMLDSFAQLERKATDEIGWIALKLSCSRARAERMIRAAREEPRP